MAEVKPKTNRANRAMRRVRMWVFVVLAVLGGKYWWQNHEVQYAQPGASAAPAPVATVRDQLAGVALGQVIDLAAMQPGDWETVHVIVPYTSPADLRARLGFSPPMADVVCTQDEGLQSLLFVRGTQVVAWDRFGRNLGDFCRQPANARGVARADAKFVAKAENDGWRAFELQPR